MSEKAAGTETPARSPSTGKGSTSASQSRRPSADDASIAPTVQAHRRRSSATLAPLPHPAGDYKFSAYSMSNSTKEEIPPVPAQPTVAPPFAALPARYQNYRSPVRTVPGGRFRRQQSRDVDSIDTALVDDGDESHMSEAGDRVLEIRSAYAQPPAVYPYLFEPPGTANSSLPPPTANSERANRSSGEFEYPDELMPRMVANPATQELNTARQSVLRPTSADSATSSKAIRNVPIV